MTAPTTTRKARKPRATAHEESPTTAETDAKATPATTPAPAAAIAYEIKGDSALASVVQGRRTIGTVARSESGETYVWASIGGEMGRAASRDEAAIEVVRHAPAPTQGGRATARDPRKRMLDDIVDIQLRIDAWNSAARKAHGRAYHIDDVEYGNAKRAVEKAEAQRDTVTADPKSRPGRQLSARTRCRNAGRALRDVGRKSAGAHDAAETIGEHLTDAQALKATLEQAAIAADISVGEIQSAIKNRRADKAAQSQAYAAVFAELRALEAAGQAESD